MTDELKRVVAVLIDRAQAEIDMARRVLAGEDPWLEQMKAAGYTGPRSSPDEALARCLRDASSDLDDAYAEIRGFIRKEGT